MMNDLWPGASLTILAIFTVWYLYFITKVRIGLTNLRAPSFTEERPFVSVVVAARNEERAIRSCLESLLHQSYPRTSYEIIVVDDGSTDGTEELVREISSRHSTVCLIRLDETSGVHAGRKPEALQRGIVEARGEIILTTDADCIAAETWIESVIGCFERDVVFVAGPVLERPRTTLFARMESMEFLGLITTGAGLIGAGTPIICNGANLAYRKSAYLSVGGFGTEGSSNDDESLMNRMVERRAGRVTFAADKRAIVTTDSDNTVISFVGQRIRWAAKRGHYEDRTIIVRLVALYLFFASFLLVLGFAFAEPLLWLPLAIVFIGKTNVDYFTLRAGGRMFGQSVPLIPFAVAELLHIPYIVITAGLAQFISFRWKQRTLQR